MKDKNQNMILKDNLWKVMWELSWPAVLAMVLYGFNTLLDAIFVGRFIGDVALAGVSIAYPLTTIMQGLGSFIGVGAGSVLSIAIGANDKDKQGKIMGNVNYLAIIFSIIFAIIGWFSGSFLVSFMGGTGEALTIGSTYFKITALGSFLWIYGLAGNMIIRSEGKMKTAALLMGAGLLVNAIFNYLFVVVLDFGVAGAAWATNIGMAVYFLFGFVYFYQNRSSFNANIISLRRDKDIMNSILSLGAPSLIMVTMSLIQSIVVLNVLSSQGTAFDIAFYGALFRIMNLLLTPVFGLMRAFQPVIGINYGAKQHSRVINSFWVFFAAAMILVLPAWIGIMLYPSSALGLMFKDTEFTANYISNFRYFLSIIPFLPLVFLGLTLFPATENAKPAGVLTIARQVIFYIPVMLILPKLLGLSWIYKGSLLIDVTMALLTSFLIFKLFKSLRIKENVNV